MSGVKSAANGLETMIRKSLAATPLEGPPPQACACPDDETLAAYLEETLTRKQQRAVAKHLRSCADCAEIAIVAAKARRLEQPRRFGWAAALLLWLAGGAVAGFLAVNLTMSLAGSLLLRLGAASLGAKLAVEDITVGIERGPTVLLRTVALATDGASTPIATVDRIYLILDLRRMLRGENGIGELWLVEPKLALPGSCGQEGSAKQAPVAAREKVLRQALGSLFHLSPLVTVNGGTFSYSGCPLGEDRPVNIVINLTQASLRTPDREHGSILRIDGFLWGAPFHADLTTTGASGGPSRWQGRFSLGPAQVSETKLDFLGLRSGTLQATAIIQGGEEPLYATGELDIRDGALAGWAPLEAFFTGRKRTADLAGLSGQAALSFERANYKWRHSGEGKTTGSYAVGGSGYSIFGDFQLRTAQELAGKGILQLDPSLALKLRDVLPGIGPGASGTDPVKVPLELAGTLRFPRFVPHDQ